MVYKLADAWNVGILVFLVMLGILVRCLTKRAVSVVCKWASKILRQGSKISVMILGVLDSVDDYLNCSWWCGCVRSQTGTKGRETLKRKQIGMLIFLAVIVILLFVT